MIWCIKTYTIAYVKIQKKWRYTIHYVKPTAQLLFKNRFPKGGPTCRRQVVVITCNHIYLIHQCNRLITYMLCHSIHNIYRGLHMIFHSVSSILFYPSIHLHLALQWNSFVVFNKSSWLFIALSFIHNIFYHIVPQMCRMLMLHGLF